MLATIGATSGCLVSVDDMEDVNELLHSTDGHEVTLCFMGCTTKQKGKRMRAISDVDSNDSSSDSERPAMNNKSWYEEKLERVDETKIKAWLKIHKHTVPSLGRSN